MGKNNKKLTQEEFESRIYDSKANITVTGFYINSNTKVELTCNKCNSKILKTPNAIFKYIKDDLCLCQNCGGKSLKIGKNDLWTTDPDIAKLLKNQNEGYTVTRNSEKKLDWVCPDCGTIIRKKSVYNTCNHNLVCPLCGKSRSLGHRIINAILDILNIEFINEKCFNWSDNKSYDIYIPKYNTIIEANGLQHYEYCFLLELKDKTLEEEQANDAYKKNIALNNGIDNYFQIDCRESDFSWILNSIINDYKFSDFIKNISKKDISSINPVEILESINHKQVLQIKDLFNKGYSVTEISQKIRLSNSVVTRYLHILTDSGHCEYKGVEEKYKPVVCLNTLELFENIKLAGEKYNIEPNNISYACSGKRNRTFAGKDSNGIKLKWLYKDDFDKLQDNQVNDIINKTHKKTGGSSKVVCLNTHEIFDKIKDAVKKYPDAKGISDCCRHISHNTGTLSDGTKLCWEYYDNYIKMTKEDINNVINYTNDKRVICINTKEIFENATIASKWCGVSNTAISNVCLGRNIFSGFHPITGEKLQWMKYSKYIKLYN